MTVFSANISYQVSDYLIERLNKFGSFEKANQFMYESFGFIRFFNDYAEFETLKQSLSETLDMVAEPDRAEYGDFQTNSELADKVALHLVSKAITPEVVIEPTCGKGNFIIASLRHFKSIRNIFGIEIYKPYVWETKFSILDYLLTHPDSIKPEIEIVHCNVFGFDFQAIAKTHASKEILVIGNPPWVTNAKLSSLNSVNLPQKSNFKNQSGLDAMTGKSNFDIAEFITQTMIETFHKMEGHVLLLVKNTVIKNIIYDQNRNRCRISDVEKYCIDSKKEFNVSVEAALFYCKLNSHPAFNCTEFDFYNRQYPQRKFGWVNGKFVANTATYIHTEKIDGECPFVWRQGLKHDCSAVMELEKVNGLFVNRLGEEVTLENDLVYGLLKSSDLKNTVITQTRKFTIVTQKKVGQDTAYINTQYPKTGQYLTKHQAYFTARKSGIYLNKPPFSLFGIGDYSFKPYKVAISGLYKTFHFTLVLPQNRKPVMLDDTCYFIGFDKIEYAVFTLILLNSRQNVQFLESVTFSDAKRTFTKDILMRIDLLALTKLFSKTDVQSELEMLNEKYKFNLTLDLWDSFIGVMTRATNGQMAIFS